MPSGKVTPSYALLGIIINLQIGYTRWVLSFHDSVGTVVHIAHSPATKVRHGDESVFGVVFVLNEVLGTIFDFGDSPAVIICELNRLPAGSLNFR